MSDATQLLISQRSINSDDGVNTNQSTEHESSKRCPICGTSWEGFCMKCHTRSITSEQRLATYLLAIDWQRCPSCNGLNRSKYTSSAIKCEACKQKYCAFCNHRLRYPGVDSHWACDHIGKVVAPFCCKAKPWRVPRFITLAFAASCIYWLLFFFFYYMNRFYSVFLMWIFFCIFMCFIQIHF